MIENITQQIAILLAITIGILLATAFPFWDKKKEPREKTLAFNKEYLVTATTAFLIALITAWEILPSFEFDAGLSMWGILIAAVIYGFGWNRAINYAWDKRIKWWLAKLGFLK